MADAVHHTDYAGLFHATPTPCIVLTPDLRIVDANSAYLRATGRSRDDLVGRSLFEAFPANPQGEDGIGEQDLRASVERVVRTGRADALGVHRYDIPTPDGSGYVERYWSPLTVPVLDEDGEVTLLLHRVDDVTDVVRERQADEADLLVRVRELRALNDELRQARDLLATRALHDPLTGLLVRSAFLEQASHVLARLERHRERVAMLFVDLDRLKHVNDTYGHVAGDVLIRSCADRIRAAVRPSDAVARLGGDEFVVLLQDLHEADEAQRVAERVLRKVREPCRLPSGVVLDPTASVGVAVADGPEVTAGTLLSRADAAMYRAKQTGRGRVETFDEATHATLRARERRREELAAALPAGQLRLHYEPVLDLLTREMYGVEPLLLWDHPSEGVLDGAQFLDDVRDVTVLAAVGRWVLDEVCRQLADWDRRLGSQAPRRAFVEIPAADADGRDVVALVTAAAERAGVVPERLLLQVTDRGRADVQQATREEIDRLRGLGCGLAIDHFGTGYSLTALVDLPADVLMVDRTFIRDLARSRESMAIVSAVLLLAHNLRKQVVAEGVRDVETLQTLRDLGCEYGLGPCLAPAGPPEALERWVLTRAG